MMVLCCGISSAQDPNVVSKLLSESDTAAYVPAPEVNEAYAGADIFDLLSNQKLNNSGVVTVEQSSSIKTAMHSYISKNQSRRLIGYRVRIFFDNSQNARAKSESVAGTFSSIYPGVSVYRNYVSPFFKVTVGDFRTRTEAQLFAQQLTGLFPSVFLVKEPIHYPSIW